MARFHNQEQHDQDQRGKERAPGREGLPAVGGGIGDAEDEEQQAGSDGQGAGPVETGTRAASLVIGRQDERGDDQREDGNGSAHDKGRAPADEGRCSTQHHAEHEARGAGGGEDAERLGAGVAFTEDGEQQGEGGRRGEGGGNALDQARGDERRGAVDETAGNAGEGKDGERPEEDATVAEEIGDAAAEQQEAAIAEYIGTDCPLQGRRLHAQLFLNCGQGHADGGDIHGVEEIGGAEQQQRQSRPASGLGRSHRDRSFLCCRVLGG